MKTIQCASRTVAYEEAGTGRVLVFLHAFPLSPEMWRDQIEEFSPRWRVIAPAAPGICGTTPFDGAPSVERIADDTAELLDALGISEPVVLCGLSMGGYAAQWFARKHGSRLSALVLCDTKSGGDDEAGRAKRDELIAFAAEHTAPEIADRVLPNLLGATTLAQRNEVIRQVQSIIRPHQPAAIANLTRALRDRPDMTPWLADIATPVQLIFGDEDALAPRPVIEALRGQLCGSRLEVLHGAGHLSNLETPAAFNAALDQFLQLL